MISVVLFKMGKHCGFHLSFFQIVGAWRDFTFVKKLIKISRVYMVLGDTVSQLQRFVWILNHISWSITLSLFTLTASYQVLVDWPISTWSFMCWCQFIDWLKFETRPSSLLNFRMAKSQLVHLKLVEILNHVLRWPAWFVASFGFKWPTGGVVN